MAVIQVLWSLVLWVISRGSWGVQRFIYRPWSFLWRFILEGKFEGMWITPAGDWSLKELLVFYKACTWVKDPWYYLDVISSPEKFFTTLEGDCDEFAVFAGAVLSRVDFPGHIMSVTWYDKEEKKFGGHNVFLFKDQGKFYHIGNWGLWGPFKGKEEAIDSILGSRVGLTYGLRNVNSLKWYQGGCLYRRD